MNQDVDTWMNENGRDRDLHEETIEIPTHWVVFQNTAREGYLNETEIDDLMAIANQGFSDTPFEFVRCGEATRVVATGSDTLEAAYADCASPAARDQMKTMYRVTDDPNVLTVFVCDLYLGGYQGLATMPPYVTNFTHLDGIVLMNPNMLDTYVIEDPVDEALQLKYILVHEVSRTSIFRWDYFCYLHCGASLLTT